MSEHCIMEYQNKASLCENSRSLFNTLYQNLESWWNITQIHRLSEYGIIVIQNINDHVSEHRVIVHANMVSQCATEYGVIAYYNIQ